eukprot:6473039-Amphidinium_carterae.1
MKRHPLQVRKNRFCRFGACQVPISAIPVRVEVQQRIESRVSSHRCASAVWRGCPRMLDNGWEHLPDGPQPTKLGRHRLQDHREGARKTCDDLD